MKIKFAAKWSLPLASAFLLVAASANAGPKDKTIFDMFVPVAPQPIRTSNVCGNLSGALSADDFFDGLVRIEARHRVEFRKASQTVSQFPSQVAVALAGNFTPCAAVAGGPRVDFVRPGNGSSPQRVNDFINGLRLRRSGRIATGSNPCRVFP